MMTVHSVSAGQGYRYFTQETARRDGIDYYADAGKGPTQHGRWLGSGIEAFGGGGPEADALAGPVTEEQLKRLFGQGRDPISGEPLGRAFRQFRSAQDRGVEAMSLARAMADQLEGDGIVVWAELASSFERTTVEAVKDVLGKAGVIETGRAAALGVEAHDGRFHGRNSIARLASDMSVEDLLGTVDGMEFAGQDRQAVAGWDHTFSPPKSFSALWAIADDELRARLMAVHEGAWQATMAKFESDVARSRSGAGGVVATEIVGIAAVAFDHSVSRMGDPQPHTHVVVSSKVRSLDGRWLALDGQPVFAAAVSLSERYQAELEARATKELGVEWVARSDQRPMDPHPIREIRGIPEELIHEWSARRRGMERVAEALEADWRATMGRAPTPQERIRIAQEACLRTRPRKPDGRAYGSQRDEWRSTALAVTGAAWHDLVDQVRETETQRTLQEPPSVDELAQRVVGELERSRAWWTVRHVEAEVARTLRDVNTEAEWLAVRAEAVTEAVMADAGMVSLEPDTGQLPAELAWPAGGSVFRPADTHAWTSDRVLSAEQDLLAGVERLAGFTATHTTVDEFLADRALNSDGPVLGPDQSAAVRFLAAGGGQVAVLIGPAGTGKTTTLAAYTDLIQDEGGRVLALAPSAVAADVLERELDVSTATIDQLQAAHEARAQLIAESPQVAADTADAFAARWGIGADTVVIVDEASLAPTPKLAWIRQQVAAAGAKLVLVGDPAQLAAVEAGGALRMLAAHAPHVALEELHRFHHDWEAQATLQVRDGDPSVIATYHQHDRISFGDRTDMLDLAYREWSEHGQEGLLLTATNREATALNERARGDRVTAGIVDDTQTVELRGHVSAGVGDIVVTRRNASRREISSASRITNGDRWRICAVHGDGSVSVTHLDRPGKPIRLPDTYVAKHVDLGYACTIHRAQGVTTDRAWALITGSMDRSLAYVAVTRGRESNRLLVATDDIVDWDDPTPGIVSDGDERLATVLARESDDAMAATDMALAAEERERSVAEQVARYRHIYLTYRNSTGADDVEWMVPESWRDAMKEDPEWGELSQRLRALAGRDDAAERVATAIGSRTLIGVDSPARVLAWRLDAIAGVSRQTHQLPDPPDATDTSDVAHWLRNQHDRIVELATDSDPDGIWRRHAPAHAQTDLAIWRAEHNWHHPDIALPAAAPARPRARRGWHQLQETINPPAPQRTRPEPTVVPADREIALRVPDVEDRGVGHEL